MKKFLTLLACAALLFSGCAPTAGPHEQAGTLIGAGTGAWIGSHFGHGEGELVGVAIGTLAGALIGQSIGRTLDQQDVAIMQQNAQYALEYAPTRTTTPWRNPDSGHYGTITPTETYQQTDGRYCREYRQNVWIGNEQQQAYGTACRQPDGSWKIVR